MAEDAEDKKADKDVEREPADQISVTRTRATIDGLEAVEPDVQVRLRAPVLLDVEALPAPFVRFRSPPPKFPGRALPEQAEVITRSRCAHRDGFSLLSRNVAFSRSRADRA